MLSSLVESDDRGSLDFSNRLYDYSQALCAVFDVRDTRQRRAIADMYFHVVIASNGTSMCCHSFAGLMSLSARKSKPEPNTVRSIINSDSISDASQVFSTYRGSLTVIEIVLYRGIKIFPVLSVLCMNNQCCEG